MAKQDAAAAADGQPKKSRLKLIILIVVGLLLAVGLSVGGTWFILSKGDKSEESAEPAAAAAPVRQPAVYLDMQPAFVVNFNVEGRTRYLQVSMAAMGRDAAAMDKLKVHMPVLRNRLVMLLAGQDFKALLTPLGKELLLQQALASVQELAQKETGSPVIEQVLFTNFVLQ